MRKSDRKLIGEIIKGIFFIYFIPIFLIIILIKYIIKNKQQKARNKNLEKTNNKYFFKDQTITTNSKYHLKDQTITTNEKYFLDIIKNNFNNYDIRFQVPLSSIIEKEKVFENQYQNELNRIVDIGIFDIKTTTPILLIEINDNTHHRKDRQIRDAKVKNICQKANLKLITFWTEYENKEEYIVNRIKKELEDSN